MSLSALSYTDAQRYNGRMSAVDLLPINKLININKLRYPTVCPFSIVFLTDLMHVYNWSILIFHSRCISSRLTVKCETRSSKLRLSRVV